MRKLLTIAMLCIGLTSYGQELDMLDADYFTGDFTYDMVADRLACAEQTVQLTFNERVYAFINYFVVKNRPYMKDVMAKSSFYFPLMEEKLAKYNLPDELKYLSIVESGGLRFAHAVSARRQVIEHIRSRGVRGHRPRCSAGETDHDRFK